MYTKEELQQENFAFLSKAGNNVHDYLTIVSAIGRFHKYSLPQQVGFALHAAADMTACATIEQWENLLHRNVDKNARGIPLLENALGRGDVRIVYDIADTQPQPGTLPPSNGMVWRFDEKQHANIIHSMVQGDAAIPAKIMFLADAIVKNEKVRAKEKNLLSLTVAAAVLERLGYEPSRYMKDKITTTLLQGCDVNRVLATANPVVMRVLNPISKAIRNQKGAIQYENLEENPLYRELGRITGTLSAGAATREIHRTATNFTAGSTSKGDRSEIQESLFGTDGPNGREGGSHPGTPKSESDVMGSENEQSAQSGAGNPAAGDLSVEAKEYKYYLHSRPVSPGAVPAGFVRFDEEDPGDRYGAIFYDHPLTDREIRAFELGMDPAMAPEPSTAQEAVPASKEEATSIDIPSIEENPSEAQLEPLKESFSVEDAKGYKKEVFAKNIIAIQLMKTLQKEQREGTPAEKEVLRQYMGFGGIQEAFDIKNPLWEKEHQALVDTLTKEEYQAAMDSVLNAHFTPTEVIQEIHTGLKIMGFQGGNVLEPSCGTGRFFSEMPETIQRNSHLVGVELDILSGQIAKAISPQADIKIKGFEKTTFPNQSFDIAIGNVPFGNYTLSDPAYDNEKFLIHDYFLAKMMDQVRPGGVVAAITSRGTMDKQNSNIRAYMAERSDLVAAIRLPNSTFKEAGTGAVADLLVFQKRERVRDKNEPLPNWVETSSFNGESDIFLNPYFKEHPENVLGTLEKTSTAYGFDLTCKPKANVSLKDALHTAMLQLPQTYEPSEQPLQKPKEFLLEEQGKAPYSFFYENGVLMFAGSGPKNPVPDLRPKQEEKIRSAIRLREYTRGLIRIQLHHGTDTEVKEAQVVLNQAYDTYVAAYGHIQEDTELKKLFGEDSSYPLLRSLEKYEKEAYQGKSDIFTKRTINPNIEITHADNFLDALSISMLQKGRVDPDYMAFLTDSTPQEVLQSLEGSAIFYNFDEEEYQIAEEYLSGDICEKMELLDTRKKELEQRIYQVELDKYLPPLEDIPPYTPQNVMEEEILQKKSYDDLSYAARTYLRSTENTDFLAHVDNSFYVQHDFISYSLDYQNYIHSGRYIDPLNCRLQDSDTVNRVHSIAKIDYLAAGNSMVAGKPISAYREYYTFLSNLAKEQDVKYQRHSSSEIINKWKAFHNDVLEKIEAYRKADASPEVQKIEEEIVQIEKNQEALRKVRPKELTPSEIQIELGAAWIPPEDIEDFLADTFSVRKDLCTVSYSATNNSWEIENKRYISSVVATSTYGVPGMNGFSLAEHALNMKEPKIKKTIYVNGAAREVVAEKETLVAKQKMKQIQDEFRKWIWKDPARAKRLCAYYNRHFNNIRPREYDGSSLTFPGMNTEIALQSHQKDAVARILYGGNALLAHTVGAGKTFEMCASIMEAKRLGISKKAMVVVPKHLTEQFGSDFQLLYPGAKILVATPKDFEKDQRKEFCAKIATQDWDAVVLGYTQFEKIPISTERLMRSLQQQIFEITSGVEALEEEQGNRFTIKQMTLLKKKLETRLDKLTKEKTDQTVNFEELGIDRLCIDEAHYFKNLFTYTKMQNIPGIQTTDAKKTSDVYEKCKYINEITNEKGLVMATGTPVSNSMVELFTLQRYLQPKRLKQQGFTVFDAWASVFGKITSGMELSPDGKSFRSKTRFAKFTNLPELLSMFKEVADIKTADMLNLAVPEAEYIVNKMPPSQYQKDFVADLARRAEQIHQGNVKPEDDNMLKVTREGRLLALDQRLVLPDAPDDPASKVNQCVTNVTKIYKDTAEQRSTQMIFCDWSTSKKGVFNVYDDVKAKLIAQGIPADEIAFVQDANTEAKKEALFAKVRSGEIRVVLGSTSTMGTGTNAQDKLIAVHHLDVPWRPSDLEQRDGRIIRFGNENKHVRVFRYITEGTFDAYLWQIIENKQAFISQIFTSKSPARSAEDVDEATLSFAELKAIATGNPLIKEKITLDMELHQLQIMKSEYLNNKEKLQHKLEKTIPENIEDKKAWAARVETDCKMLAEKQAALGENGFAVTLNGLTYRTEEAAVDALREIYQKGEFAKFEGEYLGMNLHLVHNELEGLSLVAHRQTSNYIHVNSRIAEVIHTLQEIPEKLANEGVKVRQALADDQEYIRQGWLELEKHFPQEEIYQAKQMRAAEIELLLNEDKKDSSIDRKAEKEHRIADIMQSENLSMKEPIEKEFYALARKKLIGSDQVWKGYFDKSITNELRSRGYAQKDIAETLFKFSPTVASKILATEEKETAICASR